MTKGQILLFDNETNIEDEDQVEIMREALAYLENPVSGVSGYTQMKPGWKQLAENVKAEVPLKVSDEYIEDENGKKYILTTPDDLWSYIKYRFPIK